MAKTLLPPHTSKRTSKGIHAIEVNSINFGTSSSVFARNNYFNSEYGIYAIETGFNVYNSHFNFINYGILGQRNQNKSITISGNEMNYFIKGIRLYKCNNATVNINNNYFNTPGGFSNPVSLAYYGTSAIEVMNYGNHFTDLRLAFNVMDNTRNGIYLQNIYATFAHQFLINENIFRFQIPYFDLITYLSPPLEHYGIKINNCYYGYAVFNGLTRTQQGTNQTNGNEWKLMWGIQSSLANSIGIAANGLVYISSGVNFRDVCSGSTAYCNGFTECYKGIELGEFDDDGNGDILTTATIPQQGTPAHGTENIWNTTTIHADEHRVSGRNSNPIDWYFWGAASPLSVRYPYDNPASSFGTVYPQQASWFMDCPQPAFAFDRETLLRGIVRDTIVYSDFANERRYMQLCYAFHELDEDTAERLHMDANDSLYIAFYNNFKNTNIGKFRRVEKLMDADNYSDAADSLATITDTNTIETYSKTVLEIYLNIIEPGESMDAGDSTVLEAIANDCAIIGGPAVYATRAILEIDKIDNCADEEERLAAPNHIFYVKNRNTAEFVKIKPNPVHDFISINYHINENNALLKITDIAGRIVQKINLSSDNNFVKIDCSKLMPGIYFYSVISAGNNIAAGKIVKE